MALPTKPTTNTTHEMKVWMTLKVSVKKMDFVQRVGVSVLLAFPWLSEPRRFPAWLMDSMGIMVEMGKRVLVTSSVIFA